MKLFSTSALFITATTALGGSFNTGMAAAAQGTAIEAVMARTRRGANAHSKPPSKKQMKLAQKNGVEKSTGYKALQADLAKQRFRPIIRRHGAQAIVNARALDKREQLIMSKLLQQKKKWTGRQLLWKLANEEVDPAELAQFIERQARLLAKAKNEVARNYALYGVDIEKDDVTPEEEAGDEHPEVDESEVVEEVEIDDDEDEDNDNPQTPPNTHSNRPSGMPEFYEPPAAPRAPPRAPLPPHPNSHYPKEAFGEMLFEHPNANYPAWAFGKLPPQTAQLMPPKPLLKSALSGRRLPAAALKPVARGLNRYAAADPHNYKLAHLNAMKKEANAWKDALISQTQKYNELVDMIQQAKKALEMEQLANQALSFVSASPRPSIAPKPTLTQAQHDSNARNDILLAKISQKAREATQAKEYHDRMNQRNDDMLSQMAAKAAEKAPVVEKDEIDEAEEASVDKTSAIQIPPLNAMSFATQYKVALWLKENGGITYDQYENELEQTIDDPTMEELTSYYYEQQKVLRGDDLDAGFAWMAELKENLWSGLKPDPVAPESEPHHNERNDNMLAQVSQEAKENQAAQKKKEKKQLWIPPLQTMTFMTQYKVAMWLKDHDELTLEQLNNIEDSIMDPTLAQITEYYYNQQKVLNREPLGKENAWMKKLRKTLWKGLKPDPTPQL